MKSDLAHVAFSFIAIFILLAAVMVFHKKTKTSAELLRKLIHITVANWWPICLFTVHDIRYAIIGPVFFILFNSLFVFSPRVQQAFGWNDRRRNLGLIYYPVTLLIFVLLCYNGLLSARASLAGVYCMALGDGLAAITGTIWGKKKLPFPTGGKTYIGSFVMFLACCIVCLTVQAGLEISPLVLLGRAVLIAGIATVMEMLTPLGLDNLSVPLVSALLMEVLL
ncbi:MAG: hypothetical protein LKE40_09910 [Spirochaetia bacterium]|nr:hypothetical protein [Spirochaetia bacterium]